MNRNLNNSSNISSISNIISNLFIVLLSTNRAVTHTSPGEQNQWIRRTSSCGCMWCLAAGEKASFHLRVQPPRSFSRASRWWTPHAVRSWTVGGEEAEAMPAHAVKLPTVYTNCTMKILTQWFRGSTGGGRDMRAAEKGIKRLSRSTWMRNPNWEIKHFFLSSIPQQSPQTL